MATLRQRIAVEKLAEIIRKSKGQKKITMGRILKEAGFSKWTQLRSTQVVRSKGFQELLAEAIPDTLATKVHKQLLSSVRLDSYRMPVTLTDKQITEIVEKVPGCKCRKIIRPKKVKGVYSKDFCDVIFYSPDSNSRKTALDMFYKLKNLYPKDKAESGANEKIKEYLDRLSTILPS